MIILESGEKLYNNADAEKLFKDNSFMDAKYIDLIRAETVTKMFGFHVLQNTIRSCKPGRDFNTFGYELCLTENAFYIAVSYHNLAVISNLNLVNEDQKEEAGQQEENC